MATRDILDYQGNVIGQLELPDDTPDDVWSEKLAQYAKPPKPREFQNVTPRQIRTALFMMGITDSMITTAINNLSDPTKTIALIQWEYSTAFIRSNPLVTEVGALLGWTSDQLDSLWDFALTL